MYTALYRSFRPEVFEDMVGQSHIVKILKNQINKNKVGHAYLFCGTRGTGKTSAARLLAKGVNCLADKNRPCGECDNCKAIQKGLFVDVVEIDAASNNGVENIRDLRESVKYTPASGKYKVYIIDEVHMLSTGAFNALLKTLEEPPEYVIFVLATTEPQKLPPTILSRCLRLDFRRVSEEDLVARIKKICGDIGVEIEEKAARLVASNADGSVRDGLSILDQCISASDDIVTRESVIDVLGTAGEDVFIEMTDLVFQKKTSDALILFHRILNEGKDSRQFMKDWLVHMRNLLMVKFIADPESVFNMSFENTKRLTAQGQSMELDFINSSILELSKTLADTRWSTQVRTLCELCIIKMTTTNVSQSIEGILKRLEMIESGQSINNTGTKAVFDKAAQGTAKKVDQRVLEIPGMSQMSERAPDIEDRKDSALEAEKSNSARKDSALEAEKSNQAKKDKAEAQNATIDQNVAEAQNATEAQNAAEENTSAKNENNAAEIDPERVWQSILQDEEASMGSFALIRKGGRIAKTDNKHFYCETANDMTKLYMESKRDLLEKLYEKYAGKRRRMAFLDSAEIDPENVKKEENDKDIEDIADKIQNELGIEIKITD